MKGLFLALAFALLPHVAHAAVPCFSLSESSADASIEAAPAGDGSCRIAGTIRPMTGSRIGFALWLPAGWNGRLEMLGNGGYSSRMPLAQMGDYLKRGYAIAATDTGHTGDDPDFAVGHAEAITDWSWRAVHLTAERAKALTARFYGRPARASYFVGCSTGGQQAFSEAQRFPQDFDGIVAGAPGYDRVRLNTGFLWQYLSNHRPGDDRHPILSQPQLDLISQTALAECRRFNGGRAGGLLADQWADNPLLCRFDPAKLTCKPGTGRADCLSSRQVAAARSMIRGATDRKTGRQIFFPWPIGSEPGWSLYWADPANPAQPMRVNFWRIWAFDNPRWNWWSFDFGRDLADVRRRLSPTVDADNPDLTPFFARGGKMIHWHGLADPVAPPLDSLAYRRRLIRRTGQSQVDRSYRLFLAPGVGHCTGGPGPDQIDYQQAIENWVENGNAPASLTASRKVDVPEPMSRPLCPYPQVARYRGGPENEAASFACAPPSSRPKGNR